MKLSKELLQQLHEKEEWQLPGEDYFALPEKVLQFGTGVLLRGLPCFFIDKANKQGVFNGRVVVVKSTDKGSTTAFDEQDNLYTQCIRGIDGGKPVSENIINAAISRVLTAGSQWEEILACAENPHMQVVISNTTEVGIVYAEESIHANPPLSFPGKLLAFLYRRYHHFKGDTTKGMVIVPTELIPDNGSRLREILLQLSSFNQLEEGFTDWFTHHNYCCNSLVDCIVPGAADLAPGYEDGLLIMTEVYRLWAIETSSEQVKKILSFSETDAGVVLSPDINVFRELKLRLLNGTHTLSCGLAFLAGHETVKAAMNDEAMAAYMEGLMMHEIIPAITDIHIRNDAAVRFAGAVLDRFRNPAIEHRWLSICAQYTAKLKMRVLPVLLQYQQRTGHVPALMALGFAAHALFMRGGDGYTITDEHAGWYAAQWKLHSPEVLINTAFSNQAIWGQDLTAIPGFAQLVTTMLKALMEQGTAVYLEKVAAEITVS
ncbi:tagaturonate reductase [Chitinophaga sp.]|uniref:tagaturonate reductase n=1 Tax=Chitinophaga sp. TaxID=1869181 RepID=UPI002B64FA66|nr:tagaturonate reductase [Chitinophaga sp.]HWV67762.1 tagaturonate reductase [Chitinophaga sp.]